MLNRSVSHFLAIAAVASFVLAISPMPGQAGDAALSLSAAKKHVAKRHVVKRQSVAGGQIACTVYGCQRIPARCTPTTEFNFWGNPTGYDAVACR
jgi:hypothetical protein